MTLIYTVELCRPEYGELDTMVHLEFETLEDASAAVELLSQDRSVERGVSIVRLIAAVRPAIRFTPVES